MVMTSCSVSSPMGRVADTPAVTQHRYPVGDAEDLREAVGHVEHGRAALAQLDDDLEEAVDLSAVQRRRGLVHDHHAEFLGESLGDLHQLSVGDAEELDPERGLDVKTQALEDLS